MTGNMAAVGAFPLIEFCSLTILMKWAIFLKEWYSQKGKLRTRKITGAKYLEWMLQWPTEKENN